MIFEKEGKVQTMNEKRLYRDKQGAMVAGVCTGLGDYFGIDPVIIRLVWAVLIFAAGTGLLAYIICWIIIPEAPDYYDSQFRQ